MPKNIRDFRMFNMLNSASFEITGKEAELALPGVTSWRGFIAQARNIDGIVVSGPDITLDPSTGTLKLHSATDEQLTITVIW